MSQRLSALRLPELLADHWPLAVLWLSYFILHSLLATASVKRWLCQRTGLPATHYRQAYNAFALLSLVPMAFWLVLRPGLELWAWHGIGAWLANALALLALVGVWNTARHYDMGEFLGVAPAPGPRLRLSPLHRHVRHPWYGLGLLFLWTRDMTASMLVTALLISAYLVVGSRLEDRRLVEEFGDVYRRYRDRVPGLLPWPGRALSAGEAAELMAASGRR